MIVGLTTETVTAPRPPEMPDDMPDIKFVLRKELTPWEVQEAQDRGIRQTRNRIALMFGHDALDRQEAEAKAKAKKDAAEDNAEGDNVADNAKADDSPKSWRSNDVIVDMEWAALQCVQSWSYRLPGDKKMPVDRKHLRMLHRIVRDWLYDYVWTAMQPSMENASAEGN